MEHDGINARTRDELARQGYTLTDTGSDSLWWCRSSWHPCEVVFTDGFGFRCGECDEPAIRVWSARSVDNVVPPRLPNHGIDVERPDGWDTAVGYEPAQTVTYGGAKWRRPSCDDLLPRRRERYRPHWWFYASAFGFGWLVRWWVR